MVTLIHVHQGVQKLFIFTHNDTIMRNSRRFKCAPTFGGSLSIHMFTLLFRLIADSSVFTSDFTWECMNAIETGRPFDKMCDNFFLFILEEWTIALILITSLYILVILQTARSAKISYYISSALAISRSAPSLQIVSLLVLRVHPDFFSFILFHYKCEWAIKAFTTMLRKYQRKVELMCLEYLWANFKL